MDIYGGCFSGVGGGGGGEVLGRRGLGGGGGCVGWWGYLKVIWGGEVDDGWGVCGIF